MVLALLFLKMLWTTLSNTMQHNFSSYLSPFSWRYGSEEMRKLFSEEYKYTLWRKIWVALAEVQHEAGFVSSKELADLKKHQGNIDIERCLELEKEVKHDVVAAIKEFAEKAKIGGGKIHLGATSMDVVDNAESIRTQEALDLIEGKIIGLLKLLSEKITEHAGTPCLGYTHLQPAEPTTIGYRLAFYAQDLLIDLETLHFVQKTIQAKGLKGAVGTAASYDALLEGSKLSSEQLETEVLKKLGLEASLITSQTYTRKFDFLVTSLLSSIASSLSKFAADLRILQSPLYGEWSEPFGKKQVGSSAMPFKRNPINCEKICSLARLVLQLPAITLENASLSYLERTLDDSANRRVVLSESFLAVDEILITAEKIMSGMVFNKQRIAHNLEQYASFAATESILLAGVKKGANRQELHEHLRELSLQAWEKVQQGEPNPLPQLFTEDAIILKYVSAAELKKFLAVSSHTGTAKKRALKLVKKNSILF